MPAQGSQALYASLSKKKHEDFSNAPVKDDGSKKYGTDGAFGWMISNEMANKEHQGSVHQENSAWILIELNVVGCYHVVKRSYKA